MRRINAPGSYVQGPHLLAELGVYYQEFPDAGGAYLLVDGFILDTYGPAIEKSFSGKSFSGIRYLIARFGSECCMEEVDRHRAAMDGCGVIFGIGGGKVQDTAKALGHFAQKPVVIVPTAASSDAPCSRLAVLHKADGSPDRYLPLAASPALVLADTAVIAAAPPRLLAAGMGDALATWYEADACRSAGALTPAGAMPTKAALALARQCRNTVLEDGLAALEAAKRGEPDEALENVVEANTYLSGLGFAGGGLAAAHAVDTGLSLLQPCAKLLHGEKVAFGLIIQLLLELAPPTEVLRIADFCNAAGLPVCLQDLGLAGTGRKKLLQAAERACAPDTPMKNMPFAVHPEDVLRAMEETVRFIAETGN